MAGENNDYLSGVLDGHADITASDREKQAQTEIDTEIAVNRVLAATRAMFPAPEGSRPTRIATGSGSGSGSGSGYKFDPATIAQRITDWEEVLNDIKNDEVDLRAAWRSANPPSVDRPAVKNAQDTRASLQAAIDQNLAIQEYTNRWIEALRKATGTYVDHDHETSKGLEVSDTTTDGHGLD